MKQTLLKLVTAMLVCCAAVSVQAQTYNGMHKPDSVHKHEALAYADYGYNIVCGNFGGLAGSYKWHITDRWHIGADGQIQFGKQLYSIDVQGGYRLPIVKWLDAYFDAKLMYNNYHRWHTNELSANLSLTLETPYFNVRIGESLITYHVLDFRYNEPLTLTFGLGVCIRPRWNSWNIGLFARNYDDFYYENWNINWGLNFYANLIKDMQLFGELNIRPAGSISQLASKYELSLKMGVKYVW